MSVRVSCPYCNHAARLATPPPAGRVTCPRCGDSFPYRGPAADDGDGPTVEAAPPPTAAGPIARRGWPLRRVAVVAVALGMVGLAVGLVVAYNRGGDRPAEPPGPDPAGATVPPAGLAGLRLLPPGCNVVAAVQAGPILGYAARTGEDPRAILLAAGVPPQVFATLDAAGVPLDQIDHLAFGAHVPGPDDPAAAAALALVLRRPPDDEDRFLKGLKASRDGGGRKDRYTVALGGVGIPLDLVRVSGREWVIGLGEGSLGRAAAGGEPGAGHLPAGLRELLGDKLPPDAAVWLAADDRNWADKPLVSLVVKGQLKRPEVLPVLAKAEAVAAGLSLGDPPRARTFVRTTDEANGERLRAYFQGKAAAGAVVGGAGRIALHDAPYDPRSGPGPFRPFLDDLGR